MSALSKPEIFEIVNRYIGVSGGYLGDFSYRTHREFYGEYCDLDINPDEIQGTTRERFLHVLMSSDPSSQARILRGVLQKYPVGSSVPDGSGAARTEEAAARIKEMIAKLDDCGVPRLPTVITSAVVDRAIQDAEALLRTTGAPSGIDRMHTAFHGFLKLLCDQSKIAYGSDPSITELYKFLRQAHPNFTELGPHPEAIDRILKSFASAVDSLNTLRNRASTAHPNESILRKEEAYLYVNVIRTLMSYFDAKALTKGPA